MGGNRDMVLSRSSLVINVRWGGNLEASAFTWKMTAPYDPFNYPGIELAPLGLLFVVGHVF